ncbi:MAG TPA: PilZ domain-containing protein [Humisphaera sp.]
MLLQHAFAGSADLDLDTDHADLTDAERRRGLRVRDVRPVKVYEPGAARYFGGQTEDVSATGLRIELPLWAPLRIGENVTVHVGLNGRGQGLANRRNMIPARVVWVNRTPGKHARLEAGVEFLNGIAPNVSAA